MNRKQLGSTELHVSTLGFGCSRIGGMSASGPKRKETLRLLREAHDRGINFFDTADAYADGDSESVIGEAFQGRRDRVVIATKGGYCFDERRVTASRLHPIVGGLQRVRRKVGVQLLGEADRFSRQDFSDEYLIRAVEGSLRRLRTDYIDLYQLHAPRAAQAANDRALEALTRLQQAGKIRYIGVGLEEIAPATRWLDFAALDAIQVPFGLLDPEAKRTLFPAKRQRNVAVLARGVFGGGLLKSTGTSLQQDEPKVAQIAKVARIAADSGRSMHSLALHYVLGQPEIDVILLGMYKASHLAANLNLLREPPLPQDLLAALDAAANGLSVSR